MNKPKYIEPTLEEGQELLRIWQSVTQKPITSREVLFARAVLANHKTLLGIIPKSQIDKTATLE